MTTSSIPDSTEPVNVAVVGLGFMGVTHLRVYLDHPMARIVAVCDAVRAPENGVLAGVGGNIKGSADIHLGPDVKVYRKLEEVLADPSVQVVDLCTPTPVHQEQVMAALKAGKHVICEKPLARSSADTRKILEVVASSPGFLMPAMCMRFWPGWSWLKQVVEDQPYGKILAAGFRRVSAMPGWSQQGTYSGTNDMGGALFDLHVHDSDFIYHLFGRPEELCSTGVTNPEGAIHHVVTQYRYPGGPAVHAEGSWLLAKGFNMSYTILCERATLDFDLARGQEALQITETGGETRVEPLAAGDGYAAEIHYFIDCVANQRPPAVVTGEDGAVALEICEAEERSIRSGAPVKL